jgi:hypothetical protein
MVKRLSIVVIIILAVFTASEFLLPRMVGSLVARGMSQAVGSEQVTARVEKTPALLVFGGQFDSVAIRAVDARIDNKIVFAELDTVLQDVALDMGALMNRRAVVIKSVRDIDLTAVITQEELGRYLNQAVKGVKNAVVTVSGGKVQVKGNFVVGGIASVAVGLDGKIVGDGQRIKFVTERFLLNNNMVGNIGGTVLTEIPLVDLKKLPFGVGVRTITMEDGRVTIFADNRSH